MHVERTAFSRYFSYRRWCAVLCLSKAFVTLAAKFPPKRYRVKTRKGYTWLAIFYVLLGLISLAIGVFGNGWVYWVMTLVSLG
jgi:hypothetical protein